VRAPLADRLARIYRRILFGRMSKTKDQASKAAVEVWIEKSEIKVLLAEKVLVGDA
jgi:hypothetical protein